MEAKELMIGDWVDFYHPYEPEKKIVTRHRVTEIFECGLVGISNHNNPVHADHIEPVKITPEILEKNGWVYNNEDEKFFPQTWVGGGLMLQGADDCGYRIVVTSEYDDEDTNGTPFIILYVHELQHALRLCGIDKTIDLKDEA